VSRLAVGLGLVATVAVVVAAVSALGGFLVAHFGSLGGAAQGVGWGMCIGGALVAFAVGQSGSPSRMGIGGRWINYSHAAGGAAPQLWGRNPALPQSPLWLVFSAGLVFAAGIAIVVLTY